MKRLARFSFAAWLAWPAPCAIADDPGPVIDSVRNVERAVGFGPAGDFAHADPRVTAYYRCYFTGKRELPDSYDQLKLREGDSTGCSVDETKFDIFFYKIEAVASGHAPITQALAAATPERVATVVPHEDFHEQLKSLPDSIAEAAATLVGFLAGSASLGGLSTEAELFREKSMSINRSYQQLAGIYRTERNGGLAMREKEKVFASLQAACAGIPPARTFNRCVSAPNNAGLAFDHSYTKYYPLLYGVYLRCRKDLKCTIADIQAAPRKREREVVRYFESLTR